ncbi:MAG TPA: helix-turn-helix domain-containing protein [Chloroflexota bacterium]|nr:helix-turn-helix domain-containing protein [Chloroflexota bacterium]
MYRVTLTTEQAVELMRRRRDPKTKPRVRERLEMVRLSDKGGSIPQIAPHFDLTQSRVRHWIKQFLVERFDGLADRKGAGPKRRLTREILEQLRQVVGQDGRTWTAAQVNDWLLEQHGFTMNRRYLSEVLSKNGLSYKRTTRTIRHKQKPEQVAARKADLETLKKGQRQD